MLLAVNGPRLKDLPITMGLIGWRERVSGILVINDDADSLSRVDEPRIQGHQLTEFLFTIIERKKERENFDRSREILKKRRETIEFLEKPPNKLLYC